MVTPEIRDEWKDKFVKHCIRELPGFTTEPQYDTNFVWWKNPINAKSLRLHATGYSYLQSAKWPMHYCKGSYKITLGVLLALERNISEPYYLDNKNAIAFVGTEAPMMLALYGNDLSTFVKSFNN